MHDGTERTLYVEGEVCLCEDGRIARIAGIAQDITERRRAEEKIRYLAYFDSVTGLPNRSLLRQMFNHTVTNAKRYNRQFALLFLDLDHFKKINDTLGHDAGDDLLRIVAERLKSCLRGSDRVSKFEGEHKHDTFPGTVLGGDLVTRLGGDEFVILLSEVQCSENAALVARRISDTMAEPVSLAGQTIFVTSSVGIALYPIDGQDFDSLLKKADAAMYHAKENGRNCSKYFTHSLNEHAQKRFALENELRQAIENQELVLHFQPQVSLKQDSVVGVEALVRWQHPTRGLLAPGEFISIAEEMGLINAIGDWVLKNAFAQAAAWRKSRRADLKMSINLSPPEFTQPKLVENVSSLLTEHDLDPEFIELEMTETLLLEDEKACVTTLRALNEMGVKVALDDFGVGYSSLGHLKGLPLSSLKVDRSFVAGLNTDRGNNAIVRAVIGLAHSLGLIAVAEGVETGDQLRFLHANDCDQVQGFLFSRPLPARELEAWYLDRTAATQSKNNEEMLLVRA